jgi:predicted lipoprotein with Yx(FWY)xxD motif
VTAVPRKEISLRLGVVAVLAATAAVVAIGWQGPADSRAAARHAESAATVQTKKLGKLGTVLVNSKGLTLYMFVRDKQKKVTCTSQTCVTIWPPLKVKKGQKPTAGGAARKKLLGTDGRVVTYNRWPLYRYYLDRKPGQHLGQGVNLNGGKWYVLSPAGKVIK